MSITTQVCMTYGRGTIPDLGCQTHLRPILTPLSVAYYYYEVILRPDVGRDTRLLRVLGAHPDTFLLDPSSPSRRDSSTDPSHPHLIPSYPPCRLRRRPRSRDTNLPPRPGPPPARPPVTPRRPRSSPRHQPQRGPGARDMHRCRGVRRLS